MRDWQVRRGARGTLSTTPSTAVLVACGRVTLTRRAVRPEDAASATENESESETETEERREETMMHEEVRGVGIVIARQGENSAQ